MLDYRLLLRSYFICYTNILSSHLASSPVTYPYCQNSVVVVVVVVTVVVITVVVVTNIYDGENQVKVEMTCQVTAQKTELDF